MNAALVDALVRAVLSLRPEEQALFEEKLRHQQNETKTLEQITEFASAVQARRDGRSIADAVVENLDLGREDRTRQQDEVLKEIFPSYNPPPRQLPCPIGQSEDEIAPLLRGW
jgi:hypothetical protein